MITRPCYSEALTRAIARHEQWRREQLAGEAHVHTSRALVEALQATPGGRREPLRMVKAHLRTGDGPT